MTPTFFIVAVVIIVLLLLWFLLYNRLVKLRNTKDEALANIATQEQRRYDLIGNLVETVKGYTQHETSLLTAITEARAQANGNITPDVNSVEEANRALNTASRELNIAVENYPELRANENFLALQEELATTENKMSYARGNFNSRVNDYNTAISTIPSNLIAKVHKFTPENLFTISTPEAKNPVKVTF